MDTNKYLIDLSDSNRTDFGYVAFAKQSEVQKPTYVKCTSMFFLHPTLDATLGKTH